MLEKGIRGIEKTCLSFVSHSFVHSKRVALLPKPVSFVEKVAGAISSAMVGGQIIG